ncbi:MAG TPA: uroporphyrinogen-III synthase [Povalibacter sp.]|uniref:uroporphyrinogen-III synthase n=1 Tax=Povalibacter sp. TaxID=1962978 RepID=UPI002B9008F9|nr:uroporphyrinogen-III synthase [Povalibacter sp.]HMN47381.1 uroporphyrinogen-III synthase [Povalibacter sp.]
MIPFVIPPLTGLSVLVTRPLPQADALATTLRTKGAEAVVLPAIEIRPRVTAQTGEYDLVVFVSVNAVEHGARSIVRSATTRVAAIGKATAAALTGIEWPVHVVPDRGFTSESLLAHPDLAIQAGARVLIVRGSGGRDVLQQTFVAQGLSVDLLDAYERILPQIDAAHRDRLEADWTAGEIQVATATSVETLSNLLALLGTAGRECLLRAPLIVPSPRVREAAQQLGLRGECVVAGGADDASILGALAYWHARARAAA